MKTYKLDCSMGHEPMSWTTQANSMEEAATAFMGMQELKDHVAQMHTDWAGKSEEEMKTALMGMIKEEGGDMASAPAM
jgi:hypothetical protein